MVEGGTKRRIRKGYVELVAGRRKTVLSDVPSKFHSIVVR